jgi:hypothetical protein
MTPFILFEYSFDISLSFAVGLTEYHHLAKSPSSLLISLISSFSFPICLGFHCHFRDTYAGRTLYSPLSLPIFRYSKHAFASLLFPPGPRIGGRADMCHIHGYVVRFSTDGFRPGPMCILGSTGSSFDDIFQPLKRFIARAPSPPNPPCL